MTDIETAKQIVADAFNGGLAAGRKNGLMEASTLLSESAISLVKNGQLTAAGFVIETAAKLLELAK